MLSSNSPILPNFPQTQIFKELRFHLKELYYDILNLVKRMNLVCANFTDTPETFCTITYEMESISGGIEHDVLYHFPEVFRYAEQITGKPLFLEIQENLINTNIDWTEWPPPSPNNEELDTPDKLFNSLQQLNLKLQVLLEKVERVAFIQKGGDEGLEQLEVELEKLADIPISQCLLDAIDTHLQAWRLHRVAQPRLAAEDDYIQMMDREESSDVIAFKLESKICPNCDSAITLLDSSCDVYYCENCRTYWSQVLEFAEEEWQ